MTEIEAITMLNRLLLRGNEKEIHVDAEEMDEALEKGIKALERMQMKENADGCKGCAFEEVNEWELPCAKCKRNSKDYWRAKRGNEDERTD